MAEGMRAYPEDDMNWQMVVFVEGITVDGFGIKIYLICGLFKLFNLIPKSSSNLRKMHENIKNYV